MKNRPVLVADSAIPLITELFQPHAEIILVDGEIKTSILQHADALFVRSTTEVNRQLLANTPVKFVGSMTAGINHLDTKWLDQQGIAWAYAAGANAQAVAEYVLATIAVLQQQTLLPLQKFTAGIIGVGHVGQALAKLLTDIGANVILIDPLRAEQNKNFISAPLTALSEADLISVHTPLTKEGKHPTYHLINEAFLNWLKPSCVVVNTSRGEVADTNALLNTNNPLCLDVFEYEPEVNLALVNKAVIATPHIAGYSLQAKHRATIIVYQKACEFFNLKVDVKQNASHSVSLEIQPTATWQEAILKIYNPLNDSQQLKQNPEKFASLRNHYHFRDEFSHLL